MANLPSRDGRGRIKVNEEIMGIAPNPKAVTIMDWGLEHGHVYLHEEAEELLSRLEQCQIASSANSQ